MAGNFDLLLDPAVLAARCVSTDDPLTLLERGAALVEDDPYVYDYDTHVAVLLHYLPPKEADLLERYFLGHKRQAELAGILNMTQAAVSYRLCKGIERLRFLVAIPQLTEADLRRDLPEALRKPSGKIRNVARMEADIAIDVDILVGMWSTTCQSEVAQNLRMSQGRVRHRFFRAVRTLKDRANEDARFKPYAVLFGKIADKGFNILREVKLPQWQGRGGNVCY